MNYYHTTVTTKLKALNILLFLSLSIRVFDAMVCV